MCSASRYVLPTHPPMAHSSAFKPPPSPLPNPPTHLPTYSKQVNIKASVLGAGCKIGTRVKIHQCVLMDNVTVSDGVTLTNTVVCSHAVIQVSSPTHPPTHPPTYLPISTHPPKLSIYVSPLPTHPPTLLPTHRNFAPCRTASWAPTCPSPPKPKSRTESCCGSKKRKVSG